MNNNKKLIFSLGAIASIGGLILGYHQYQNHKQKQRILQALKEQRYQLSVKIINTIQLQEQLIEQVKEKKPEGFSAEKIKQFIISDENFKNEMKEIRVKALSNAQVTEEEYSQAINIKFKSDIDIQEIVQQLKVSIDLALDGKRNFLSVKKYPKFGVKQFLKHQFNLVKILSAIIQEERFEQNLLKYAKEEGFHLEGYSPLYILFANSEDYPEVVSEAKKILETVFVERKAQLAENPNQKFDDEKDLQNIYKLMNVQD